MNLADVVVIRAVGSMCQRDFASATLDN